MKEVFSYKLTPDNRTIEMIDLGSSLGGLRETTAAVENGELVSYCTDPATKKVDLIAKRSIDKSKYVNLYEFVETSSIFIKRKKNLSI